MGRFIDMTGWVMAEHGVPDSRLMVIKKVGSGPRGVKWLCECSCNEHNQIIVGTHALKSGHTKSCGCIKKERITQQGYQNKQYNRYDLSNDFGIGYTNKGEPFYFDLEDYGLIKDYCWRTEPYGYLATDNPGNKRTIKMHRLVMNITDPKLHIDHINHITFDNRKSNLRVCTSAENNWNVEIRSDNKSGYPGVTWHKRDSCWEAHIQVYGNRLYLGRFNAFEDAVVARKNAEEKYFGEYSFTNSKEISTYVK